VIADTQRCLDHHAMGRTREPDRIGIDAWRSSGLRLARILYLLTPATIVVYAVIATALAKGAFGLPPMSWVGYRFLCGGQMAWPRLVMLVMVHATRCRRHIPLAAPRFFPCLGRCCVSEVPFGVVQALDTLFFFHHHADDRPAWRGSARRPPDRHELRHITIQLLRYRAATRPRCASDSFVGGMHSPMRAGLDSSASS